MAGGGYLVELRDLDERFEVLQRAGLGVELPEGAILLDEAIAVADQRIGGQTCECNR